MFCTKCGAQLPDGSKFCTKCGAHVEGTDETTVMPVANETRVMTGQPTRVAPKAPEQATQYQAPQSTQYQPAPQQPIYQSVPQQPAYQKAPSKGGTSRGAIIAAVVAIIVVAAAAVAFILLDPMNLFGIKQTAPAQAATSEEAATEQSATSEPVATSEPAATTEPATTSTPATASTPAPRGASSDYVIPDSDIVSYSADDIRGMNLSVDELWYARNEIYARHGRMFRDQTLQAHFNAKPWYTPTYSPDEFDDSVQLSSVERSNAEAIKSVEQSLGSSHL